MFLITQMGTASYILCEYFFLAAIGWRSRKDMSMDANYLSEYARKNNFTGENVWTERILFVFQSLLGLYKELFVFQSLLGLYKEFCAPLNCCPLVGSEVLGTELEDNVAQMRGGVGSDFFWLVRLGNSFCRVR